MRPLYAELKHLDAGRLVRSVNAPPPEDARSLRKDTVFLVKDVPRLDVQKKLPPTAVYRRKIMLEGPPPTMVCRQIMSAVCVPHLSDIMLETLHLISEVVVDAREDPVTDQRARALSLDARVE
jgi:hypothetical protein